MNMSGNFIVDTINTRRSQFYFVKQPQEHWETCPLQGMLHYAKFHVICVAMMQEDFKSGKLQETLPS